MPVCVCGVVGAQEGRKQRLPPRRKGGEGWGRGGRPRRNKALVSLQLLASRPEPHSHAPCSSSLRARGTALHRLEYALAAARHQSPRPSFLQCGWRRSLGSRHLPGIHAPPGLIAFLASSPQQAHSPTPPRPPVRPRDPALRQRGTRSACDAGLWAFPQPRTLFRAMSGS